MKNQQACGAAAGRCHGAGHDAHHGRPHPRRRPLGLPCHCAEISRETITVAASCASSVYTDVPVGDWYHEAVDYVTAEGIMNGMTGNTFEPGTDTNRAMMAVLLYRYLSK